MQGDVGPARHEDGYRFQAERPMEGDELVNPSAPFAKRKGARDGARNAVERGMPVVSPARRERRREGAVVSRAGALAAPAEPGCGTDPGVCPVKRRKSTADRRCSDA